MARVLPWRSLAFRLALSYGCMLVFTVAVVLAVFYLQIVGVLRNRLDQYATTQLKRLQDYAAMHGVSALHEQIDHLMRDGINTDTEIILLLTPEGHTIIGNADIVPARRLTQLGMRELTVQRMGRNVVGRVQAVLLPDGNYLVVGSDMRTQVSIEDLFARASSLVVLVALLSGGLAGLAGAIEVAGRTSYLTLDMSPGYGYSGIVIAMLAGLHPLGVVASAVFVAGMLVGADSMSRAVGVPNAIADVIVAASLLSVLVASLMTQYRLRRK